MHSNRIGFVAGITLCAGAAIAQSNRPYYYSVASGSPATGISFAAPVVNNNGSVAFDAVKYLTGTAILTGGDFTNDAFVSSADPNSPFSSGSNPHMNDAGSIAFRGTVRATGQTGVFVGLDTAHNLSAGNGAISNTANGINAAGQVIIAADHGLYTNNPRRNHDAIYLGQAGVTGSTLVAENTFGSVPGGYRTLERESAVINNAGQIAFTAGAWNGGSGIYGGANSDSRYIDTAGRFINFGTYIDLNDVGMLAFRASEDDKYVNGIWKGKSETDAQLVASENQTFTRLNWIDINNAGTVVFNSQLGIDHGGYNGIFNGPTFEDRVIGPGDQIFGSTVRDAFMRRGGLNDNGEVGFYYITTDSKWGVAVATPALFGDADLNRVVNFDDYARIDNGYNNQLAGWSNGDFDGNGQINFDDYALIDAQFNQQSGGNGLNARAVPEPGTLGVIGITALLCARRIRSRFQKTANFRGRANSQ